MTLRSYIAAAFTGLDADDVVFDIGVACLPIAGIAAFVFGAIDLQHEFSEQQGVRRILSFAVSHSIYAWSVALLA